MSADRLGHWPARLLGGFVSLIVIFLFAPLVIVVAQSFTGESHLGFPPESWGTRWYAEVLGDRAWRQSFYLSLIIACIVTPLTIVIGTLAAIGLDRGPLRGQRALFAILVAPMVLPHIILGLALFRIATFIITTDPDQSGWFAQIFGRDGIGMYVLGHLTITIPYVVITVGASLQTFDRSFEEAAQSLGASPLAALWYVTLPIIRPGLIGGAIFSFIISFDEFIITYFLSTFNMTLPIKIFTTLSLKIEPSIAAASTLMLGFTLVLTLLLMSRGQIVSGGKIIK
jgi:putative spermidine/putrescine transport system permease protein